MAQWLRVLITLAEDQGLVFTSLMVTHNHPQLQFQGGSVILF